MKTLCTLMVGVSMAFSHPAALAYPFALEPRSFTSYLNSLRWRDGSRVYFQNLFDCISDENNKTLSDSMSSWNNPLLETPTFKSYACSGGFATISSPQGRQVCKLQFVSWNSKSQTVTYNTNKCVYR